MFTLSYSLILYLILITCTLANEISHLQAKMMCPVGLNGRTCSGLGNCNSGICHCPTDVIGSACQFQRQLMTCTDQRHCVQCRVHKTGSFAEDNGCEEFCRHHPSPIIVDQLSVKKHEIACSFIDATNATNICRFYFKLINSPIKGIPPPFAESSHDKNNNGDVFIIAQRKPECEFAGGRRQRVRDENQHLHDTTGPSYATMFFIFLFIALPFVACFASIIQNFKSLPCGLCNPFRKPSSTYLRNVRPYPGGPIIEP